MKLEKELVKAAAEGRLYDFIAAHYREMTTWQLKEVLLAVLGVGLDNCQSDKDEEVYADLIVTELECREFGESE